MLILPDKGCFNNTNGHANPPASDRNKKMVTGEIKDAVTLLKMHRASEKPLFLLYKPSEIFMHQINIIINPIALTILYTRSHETV